MFTFPRLRKALSMGLAGTSIPNTTEERLHVKGAASVTINGKRFTGDSIVALDGEVFVDGIKVDSIASKGGIFNVTVTGNPDHVETVNGDITVEGHVTSVETVNGDVQAKLISGRCSTVNGDIKKG